MPSGTVRYVDYNRGFGFISRDDKQPKVFLHVSKVIETGLERIEKGQHWIFDVEEDEDGRPFAINLRFEPAERPPG